MSDDNEKHYNMENRPLADRVVRAIGDAGLGVQIDESDNDTAEVMKDPVQSMLVGYLAGFETALHVSMCHMGGERLVRTMAMCMDMTIHEGETEFHDIAEQLINNVMVAMAEGLVEVEGGATIIGDQSVVIVEADSPQEALGKARVKVLGYLNSKAPKKEQSDA